MPAHRLTEKPTYLDPERVYSLHGFQQTAGITATRMREGRLQGIDAHWIRVGRRKFIEGREAINYLKALAQLH